MSPPLLIASLALSPLGHLAVTLEVQWFLVDLLIGGAAIYVVWSLWRSWRGKAGCASACHSCPSPAKSTPSSTSSASSTRFPLPQL
jgi:hypothetical protein